MRVGTKAAFMDTGERQTEHPSEVPRCQADVGRDRDRSQSADRPRTDRLRTLTTWAPVAMVATAVAFAATRSVLFGALTLPPALVLAGATVADVRSHRIPARWVDGGSVVTIVGLVLFGVVDGTSDHLVAGLIIASATWAIWWMIRVTSGNGLGYGDVRLAAMAALPLGGLWGSAALLFTPAVFLVAAALLLPPRARGQGGRLPLAPAIALAWGGVLCVIAGAAVPLGNTG
jgi:leader peptidase (prepilin peptidase)/N-methyltransferase